MTEHSINILDESIAQKAIYNNSRPPIAPTYKMPFARPRSTFAGMVDSDSEDDLGISVQPAKNTKPATAKVAPAKTGRGRPAANKVTKPASSSRRSSGRIAAAVSRMDARQALSEKDGNADGQQPRVGDDDAKPKAGRGGRPKGGAKTAKGKEDVADAAPPKRGRPATKKAEVEIPETQQLPHAMDVDDADEDEPSETANVDPSVELPEEHSAVQDRRASSRWNADSSVMMADANDATLRRRLGDLTRKHEALESRYRELKEVGVKEAEKNFDKLKKQADERASSKVSSLFLHDIPCSNARQLLLASFRP